MPMRMILKRNSVTDLFDNMSEEEMQRIIALKSGLEDLNLVLQEIEKTYHALAKSSISDEEKKNQKLRLFMLEKYLVDLNSKVNTALGNENDRQKLS